MLTDQDLAVGRQDIADEELIERLTALLLTIPDWTANYTNTQMKAKWMVAEARRVGWEIEVANND